MIRVASFSAQVFLAAYKARLRVVADAGADGPRVEGITFAEGPAPRAFFRALSERGLEVDAAS